MPSRPLIGGTGLSGRVGLCPATIIIDVELPAEAREGPLGAADTLARRAPGFAADREPFSHRLTPDP